jgi:Rrf2 family protein
MGLRLTNAADYAILAMIHMACLPDDAVALRSEIAQAYNIPSSFMAKILRALVRARLLRSTRGVHGGFSLARPATEITLLDVVEAIEGPLAITDCTGEPGGCQWASDCPAHPVWAGVQEKIAETLRANTLETLVSCPRRNGHVVRATRVESVARTAD